MSIFKLFRKIHPARYFAVSFVVDKQEGLVFGMSSVVTESGALPSLASLKQAALRHVGDDRASILGVSEFKSAAELKAFFAVNQLSEECHVSAVQ